MLGNPNLYIAIAFVAGVALIITGYAKNKSSNFDDGTFIVQIICIVAGAGLVVLALVWKFVLSLLS